MPERPKPLDPSSIVGPGPEAPPEEKPAPLPPGMGTVGPVEEPSLKMPLSMPPQTPTLADDEVEEDSPGMYVVTYNNTFVSEEATIPASEEGVRHRLEEGHVVRVLEVMDVLEQNRVRARIQSPPGWISLMDIKFGYRWARKVGNEEELQVMQADIQDVVQRNDSPHEKV